MTTKVKRKMVNVEPISNKAKNRFANMMDSLHGCHVEQENDIVTGKQIGRAHV